MYTYVFWASLQVSQPKCCMHLCATCPVHVILGLITLIKFGEAYNLMNEAPHYTVFSNFRSKYSSEYQGSEIVRWCDEVIVVE